MKTADPELMRAINRFHVIDAIRRHGPVARVEIAERTELSTATVAAITGALVEESLVNIHHAVRTRDGTRGRPRVLLDLSVNAYHAVGVRLSAMRIGVAVTDARGDLQAALASSCDLAGQPPAMAAGLVEDAIRRCVAQAGLVPADISGVGIGLPGIIDAGSGVSRWSPVLGPAPVPFARMVSERLDVPTVLENDTNLVAAAEHWFGGQDGLATFAVISMGDSVGLGLVVDGRLHRGAHGGGAELAHVRTGTAGPPCRCGRTGCLDVYASEWGMLRRAEAASLVLHGEGRPGGVAGLTGLALAGDARAADLFRQAGAAVGSAVATIISLIGPPRVILTGEALRAGPLLMEPLLQVVAERVMPSLHSATEIRMQDWSEEMWAKGAATIVLRRIYEAPWAGLH